MQLLSLRIFLVESQLIKYQSEQSIEHDKYHPDYSGITHKVSWDNNTELDNPRERIRAVYQAKDAHNRYVNNNTEVGDVVRNIPAHGNPKLAKLYQKAGFSTPNRNNVQHAIVKQHPDDHPDESKRGQKYLHPLEHHEIEHHGNKISDGSNNGRLRQITSDGVTHTKINNIVHSYNPLLKTITHNQTNNSNIEHLKTAHHHAMSAHNDEQHIITSHHNPDVSNVNRHLGFGTHTQLPSGRIVQYSRTNGIQSTPITRADYLNS